MKEVFQIPIQTIEHKKIRENILDDLETLKTWQVTDLANDGHYSAANTEQKESLVLTNKEILDPHIVSRVLEKNKCNSWFSVPSLIKFYLTLN